MGHNRRHVGPISIPSWAESVGAMQENGTAVLATCQRCGWLRKPLDLAQIIAAKGRNFSLFDVKGKCPRCGGGVRFMYGPGGAGGTPYRPCVTR